MCTFLVVEAVVSNFVEMRMMGIMMIDGVGARLDGLVEVAYDFYYRRMTISSDVPKVGSAVKESKRASSLDPPLRMAYVSNIANDQLLTLQVTSRLLHTKLSKVLSFWIRADRRSMACAPHQSHRGCRRDYEGE